VQTTLTVQVTSSAADDHAKIRIAALASIRAKTRSHYSQEQQRAAIRLYHLVKMHGGTSGGNAAAKLLIGLYNGNRFPFDLTELRLFDPKNLEAALIVLRMDASHTWCEIHDLLNAILEVSYVGHEFEVWAYNMRLKGRCTKEGYLEVCKRVPA
jgi:hypothetical protein